MQCPECRSEYERKRSDQWFCSTKCNTAFEKRALKRCRPLYRALYHWRLWVGGEGRLNVAANFKFICAEVGAWIREDREAQRLPPPPHNHDADRGHQRERRPISLAAPKRAVRRAPASASDGVA